MTSILVSDIDTVFINIGSYFRIIMAIFYTCWAILYLGITTTLSSYLYHFHVLIQSFIVLYLVWRFHPFRIHTFKPTDGIIIFAGAVLLLVNMGIVELTSQVLIKSVDSTFHISIPKPPSTNQTAPSE
jgi:hypothetical protein